MEMPRLILPHERLDLPTDSPDEVDFELIMQSNPMAERMPPAMLRALVRMHFPNQPQWEESPDGKQATLHIVDQDAVIIPTQRLLGGTEVSPLNKDGITFRPNEPLIVTHGVLSATGLVHVWFGVSNFDIDPEAAMPEGFRSIISFMDNDQYRIFDERAFPKK